MTKTGMKVILANPRGFCAGVEMAIRSLQIVVDRVPGPVYVYHEIVHNRHVVEQFERQGVVFVDTISEVPRGAVLVFSAHGVSPQVRQQAQERSLTAIDATCPLVAKVHSEAVRFARLGYQIILVGHAGHDEVLGTLGEAPQQIVVVETEKDVDFLPFSVEDRLAYLTQTTLSVNETRRVIQRLEERFPQIVGPAKEDICYASQNRQESVADLARSVDMLIVIGSQNSSNSRRLCDVAREYGKPAVLLDDPSELQASWLQTVQSLGLTAGASAPESAVQSLLDWLTLHFDTEVVVQGRGEPNRVFPLPSDVLKFQKTAP